MITDWPLVREYSTTYGDYCIESGMKCHYM